MIISSDVNLSCPLILKNLYLNTSPELKTAFKKLYNSSLPYVLVLGRKSSAKNYRSTIDAVRELNRTQRLCRVVMIGRDEDGVPIDPADAFYLGEQSRGVVLSALKDCVCMVAMSQSESFGIVILEAWSQRRPVIVNKECLAYNELVEDGKTGLLATKENLAGIIKHTLQHRDDADQMGAAGFLKLERQFSWSAISTSLLRLFRGLTEDRVEESERKPARVRKPAVSGVLPVQEMTPMDIEIKKRSIQNQFIGRVPHEPDFYFLQHLDIHGLMVDVGANAGQSAISMNCVCPSASILSFEPNPLFEEILHYVKSAILKGAFDYRMAGLGKENKAEKLLIPFVDDKPYYEEASLNRAQFEKPWVVERLKRYGARLEFRENDIRTETLDGMNLLPEFVKIDVEGHECEVLQGMESTIHRCHPSFLIENNDYQRVTDLLRSAGYEVFRYDPGLDRILPPAVTTNCFYLHRIHHARIIGKFLAAS